MIYRHPDSLPLGLTVKDVAGEQGVTFAAISLVLVVVGIISGIDGVLILAGLSSLAACAFTIAKVITSITSSDVSSIDEPTDVSPIGEPSIR
jgi:hypothetical protein